MSEVKLSWMLLQDELSPRAEPGRMELIGAVP